MSIRLINRNSDYAVRALCYMAKREEQVTSVSELVRKLKIPRPFLRKILQVLHNEGLLISQKGAGGGFRLARKPGKIFLLDIMRAFQGPIKLNECVFKKEVCPHKRGCFLRRRLGTIEQFIIVQLKPITIKKILDESKHLI